MLVVVVVVAVVVGWRDGWLDGWMDAMRCHSFIQSSQGASVEVESSSGAALQDGHNQANECERGLANNTINITTTDPGN